MTFPFKFGILDKKNSKEETKPVQTEEEKNKELERVSRFNKIEVGAEISFKDKYTGKISHDYKINNKNNKEMKFEIKNEINSNLNAGTWINVDDVLDFVNPKKN
ncbi:MAG: hypothetical protein WCO35_01885 [Candidatus Nomurabacteria bacterium]